MATEVRDRRARFRQFTAQLKTGTKPVDSIHDNLLVPVPGSEFEKLAGRLDLQPQSSHLVVGGIGTGKSTQALIAAQKLNELPDLRAIYIDVSRHHDLSKLKAGVLIVVAGLTLSKEIESDAAEIKRAKRNVTRWAEGYTEWVDSSYYHEPPEPDDSPEHYNVPVQHPGILVPPVPPLQSNFAQQLNALSTLKEALPQHHIVLIMDSLDRLTDLDVFEQVVVQDVRALTGGGFGIVVVGPLTTLFGARRPIAEQFDHRYHVAAVDIEGPEGTQLLVEALERRTPGDMIHEVAKSELARLSGGVFRDLFSLAGAAGEEAYMSGADEIEQDHVRRAADAFGRGLFLGLSSDDISVLRRVRTSGQFIQSSDKHVTLLATRRILEYPSSPRRFRVHPTIEPLLDQA